MPLKVDTRAQLNLKGARITPEFLALVRKAAERRGQTVTDFVADTLTAEAQSVLKGEAPDGAALPARPEDVADKLAESVAQLAEVQRLQAAELAGLRRTAMRGRWRRR